MVQIINKDKVRRDIIQSAIGMKAHYDTWWAFVHDVRINKSYQEVIRKHSDFIKVSEDAHYNAAFVYFAHLHETKSETSSIQNYLSLIKKDINAKKHDKFKLKYQELHQRAKPLIKVRHNLVAHINAALTEEAVFKEVNMAWNEIGSVIHDSANFVALLVECDPGHIGIPRDGRLSEAVLNVLNKLKTPS